MIVNLTRHANPHLLELLRRFRLDRTYVRGRGSWLWDQEGRKVLDLSSQYGAVPFGHNPPDLWDALESVRRDEVPALIQPSRPLYAEELASRLARLAPVGDGDAFVAFLQSGTEAIEAAIRLARMATGRSLIVGAERGYHGRTLGSAALSWRSSRDLPAAQLPPGFAHVPWNDVPALEAFFAAHEPAALVIEPVQGEGGVHEADPAWVARARELCTARNTLLVFDEVQTGLGRLGATFGADLLGVRPDVICLSKALGGGLVPLAAVIAANAPEEFALGHGSTFANNNLTCRVGLAVLDRLERTDAIANARRAGEQLLAGLRSLRDRYPSVLAAVRGRGLLLAIEFEEFPASSSFFVRHLQEADAWNAVVASWLLNVHGVRVIPCLGARALRLQPPLDVSPEEVLLGLRALEDLVRTVFLRDWARLVGPLVGAPHRETIDARELERPVRASRVEVGDEPTRFAFLIHHTCPRDMIDTTPAFRHLAAPDLEALYHWTAETPGHSPLCFMPAIRGAGSVAQGWLWGVTHVPESLRARPRAEVAREIDACVREAHRRGAHVVGLGAFTSIVTANGADVTFPGALTTGSALTVATAVDGVRLACERMDVVPERAVVLGLGVVGSAAAILAAELVPELALVGNPARPERERAKADALADRIYARAAARIADPSSRGVAARLRRSLPAWRELGPRGRALAARLADLASGSHEPERGLAAEIAWACALTGEAPPVAGATRDAIRAADVVLAATSAAQPLLGPADLRPGAIVCDVAKPADVSREVLAREDVLVFDGGLVRYPEPIAFGPNLGYEPGVNLACLTETVVLALEGVREGRFGVGLASDLIDEVPRIRAAAHKHGFSVGELRMGGRVVPASRYESARRARSVR